MSATRVRRAERRLDDIADLCGGAGSYDVIEQFADTVHEVVPYDAGFWSASDPLTTIATSPAVVENFPVTACEPFWDAEHFSDDDLRFNRIARAEQPFASLDTMTDGRWAQSRRFVEFNRPMGLGDEFRVVMRTGESCWGVATVLRGVNDAAFTEAEQAFIIRATQHLMGALRRLSVERTIAVTAPAETPGLLLLDSTGREVSRNAELQRWLEELPTYHRDGLVSGFGIPTEIVNVASRARANAGGASQQGARARVRGRSGRWLVVHATTLGTTQEGTGAVTALVIEPAPESEVSAIMIEAFGLSPREREVASYVARGLDTGEIARKLFLSPHTVRDHLKTIFDKVGVNSRGEMVAALFTRMWTDRPVEVTAVER